MIRALKQLGGVEENGGRTWVRTKDMLIKSQLLYQLSYASNSRSLDYPTNRAMRLL